MIVGPEAFDLAVVVPVFGRPDDTVACLTSLREAPERLWTVVVDDASPNDTADIVLRADPNVTLVRHEENRGFAASVNSGLRVALGGNARAILLLNSDACVTAGTISTLMAALGERVAAVGAVPLDAAPPHRPQYAGSRDVNWWKLLFRQTLPLETPFASEVEPVDAACGCALLLSAEAVRDVGFLEEAFFAYHEEIDWCLRARRVGWAICVATGAQVLHRGQASGGSAFARYYGIRNQALLIRRHAPSPLHRGVALTWWAGRVTILEAVKRRRLPGGWRNALRALWDGARGATGRASI